MKNTDAVLQIEDILLKMNYDSKYTFFENKKLVEQSQGLGYSYSKGDDSYSKTAEYNKTRELPQQEGYPKLVAYTTIQGQLWFEESKLTNIVTANEKTVDDAFGNGFVLKSQRPTCDKAPTTRAESIKLMQEWWSDKDGQILSFDYDGNTYYAYPLMGCEDGKPKFGGYRKSPFKSEDIYKEPALPPAISNEIQKTADSLIELSKKNPTTNEDIADFLYELREIVSSVAFQIFSAALSIAIATIAGPWALFFSRLFDWGLDVIVLIADIIAALRYPDNETHWTHIQEDIANLGLSFGIMGVFKMAPKTLKAAANQLGPADRAAIDEFLSWITDSMDTIINLVSGTSLAATLTTFKNWVKGLFKGAFGTVMSKFVLEGIPIATAFYLVFDNTLGPLITSYSDTIETLTGIPVSWLKSWSVGEKIPEQYKKDLDAIDPQLKDDLDKNYSEYDASKIPDSELDADKASETSITILKNNAEKSAKKRKELINTNNNEYCKQLIAKLKDDNPCKKFLTDKLSENKVKYMMEAKNGGVLYVDDVAYVIYWLSKPVKFVSMDLKELDCNNPFKGPQPIDKSSEIKSPTTVKEYKLKKLKLIDIYNV